MILVQPILLPDQCASSCSRDWSPRSILHLNTTEFRGEAISQPRLLDCLRYCKATSSDVCLWYSSAQCHCLDSFVERKYVRDGEELGRFVTHTEYSLSSREFIIYATTSHDLLMSKIMRIDFFLYQV